MSDLYEDDILLWSEQQAALLRRVGHGQASNDTRRPKGRLVGARGWRGGRARNRRDTSRPTTDRRVKHSAGWYETPDWEPIAEEIEDVGHAQLNAAQSHLRLGAAAALERTNDGVPRQQEPPEECGFDPDWLLDPEQE